MSGPAFFQKEEVKSDTLFKIDCKSIKNRK